MSYPIYQLLDKKVLLDTDPTYFKMFNVPIFVDMCVFVADQANFAGDEGCIWYGYYDKNTEMMNLCSPTGVESKRIYIKYMDEEEAHDFVAFLDGNFDPTQDGWVFLN